MRYAVDAHAIGRHLTGNEVYVRSLLDAFAAIDGESEFLAYVTGREAAAAVPSRFTVRQIARNPFVRLGLDFGRKLREDRPALLHVQYTAPLRCPVPIVVSVHDVSFLEHPEYFTRARALQLRVTVARTVRSAVRIITGTEFARDSIMRAYGLSQDRISVIPDAANPFFRAANRAQAVRGVEERFRIRAPFVLSVGDLQPRKNHIGLIHAFGRLLTQYPELPHHLVLAGKDTWHGERVHEAARQSGVADRIHFPGFVSDNDLLQLYNACDCFAFPSLYEGFGLPVLEAMACGRAVVCSDTSSIPEVAGNAALLFNPAHDRDITAALSKVLLNPDLRARLERMGQAQAAHFTWSKTAEATLGLYREVSGQPLLTHATA